MNHKALTFILTLFFVGCASKSTQIKVDGMVRDSTKFKIHLLCYDITDGVHPKLELAMETLMDLETGIVVVNPTGGPDSVGIRTLYSLSGVNKVWTWGDDGVQPFDRYRLVVEPSGTALYYDFAQAEADGKVKPRQQYNCRT